VRRRSKERFVRLAFANVADDRIPAVLERLERFGAWSLSVVDRITSLPI
jgi:hypothetical protein